MKRGEIWTVSATGYAGKPRPALIIQDERFDASGSVTVCPITTDPLDLQLFRLLLGPSPENGLRAESRIMIDRIMTVPRSKVGKRVGRLSDDELLEVSRAIITYLALDRT